MNQEIMEIGKISTNYLTLFDKIKPLISRYLNVSSISTWIRWLLHNKTTSSPLNRNFHIEQDIITYQASKFDIFTDKSIPKILIAIRVKLTRHCEKIFEICCILYAIGDSGRKISVLKNQKSSKSEHWNGTIYKIEILYFC